MKQLIFVCALFIITQTVDASEPQQPNIVYLLVDDLGWSDCGFMGCKDIHTPQIDSLASQGAILQSCHGHQRGEQPCRIGTRKSSGTASETE